MKHGDIVVVQGRKAVALTVTPADLKKGINAPRAGIYPFAGYWYGKDPMNHKSYGKILAGRPNEQFRIVGKVVGHPQVKYLGI